MREIKRSRESIVEYRLRNWLMERFTKILGAAVPEGLVDVWIGRISRAGPIPVDDVKEKRAGEKTRLVMDGGSLLTWDDLLDYLGKWNSLRTDLAERFGFLLETCLKGVGRDVLKACMREGGGPWKCFREAERDGKRRIVPIPDPEWIRDIDRPVPPLRDCLPLSGSGLFGVMNYYNAVLWLVHDNPERAPEIFAQARNEAAGALAFLDSGKAFDVPDGNEFRRFLAAFTEEHADNPGFLRESLENLRACMEAFSDRCGTALSRHGSVAGREWLEGAKNAEESGEEEKTRQFSLM